MDLHAKNLDAKDPNHLEGKDSEELEAKKLDAQGVDAKPVDFIYHVTCLFTGARLDDAACKCKKLESRDYPCAHIFCVLDHLGVRTFPKNLSRKDGQCRPSQRSLLRGLRILMYGLIT